uniref:Uncharacterized protein n=1 Tax=Arundo donax TaxID=35708 RepID=A0A0A8Z098_ARUDO
MITVGIEHLINFKKKRTEVNHKMEELGNNKRQMKWYSFFP